MALINAGFAVTPQAVHTRVGNVVIQGRRWFADVEQLYGQIDGLVNPTNELIASLNMSQAQSDILWGAVTQLNTLRRVATGQLDPTGADNYFFNGNKLLGVTPIF